MFLFCFFKVFGSVFPVLPADDLHDLAQYDRLKTVNSGTLNRLRDIRGHLVNFALEFLKKEDLMPGALLRGVVSDDTFT